MKIKENPKVGVSVTTYNAEKYVRECVESLLRQTYPHLKIVISDDCSQDDTREILQKYANDYPDRIRLMINPINLGIHPNVNQSLRELSGVEYISLIAGDDCWREDKLEREINKLEQNPSARFAYSKICFIDSDSKRMDTPEHRSRGFDNRQEMLQNLLEHKLIMLNWTAEYELLKETGMFFDESMHYASDWDYHLRLVSKSEAVFCPDPTVFYRRHSESITFKGDYRLYHSDLVKAHRKNAQLLKKLSCADSLSVQRQQRQILISTVGLWLRSSVKKKKLWHIFKCLWLKLFYKITPLPHSNPKG